jgi:hypothetical protein
LREEVEEAIEEANGDVKAAGIAVCKVLDENLGLVGGGWFDDDPELRKILLALHGYPPAG